MFVDGELMKEQVKLTLLQEEAKGGEDLYHNGITARIAKATLFENFTLAIISFNVLWIAIDTDNNTADVLVDAKPQYQVVENLFCTYFTIELAIRFCAFEHKTNFFKDLWCLFDSFLVLLMIAETWVLSVFILITGSGGGAGGGLGNAAILRIARMFRLCRVGRMARLLRAVPELMILVKGIFVATRSVFFTLCLLGAIVYVFGIAFVHLCDGTDVGDTHFDNVPNSMSTLLLRGTFPDLADLVEEIGSVHLGLAFIFMIFVLLSTLMLLNMLVGVLVEVVNVVSSVEKEHMAVLFVKSKLEDILDQADENGDHVISRDEFHNLLLNPDAARTIAEVGVDVVGLADCSDFIFESQDELTLAEFMETVMSLRGKNTATVRDIVDLRKFILIQLDEKIEHLERVVLGAIGERRQDCCFEGSNMPIRNIPSDSDPERSTSGYELRGSLQSRNVGVGHAPYGPRRRFLDGQGGVTTTVPGAVHQQPKPAIASPKHQGRPVSSPPPWTNNRPVPAAVPIRPISAALENRLLVPGAIREDRPATSKSIQNDGRPMKPLPAFPAHWATSSIEDQKDLVFAFK
jgi:voltage-gated sodium channel